MSDSALRDAPLPYAVWGEQYIDAGSRQQMDNAMRLPVSVAGALMPDAHVGYGLPIGGVLATEGAVIPYAVGVDIACLTGDTKIPLLDGKDYTLEELSQRTEPFPVYACKPNGKIVVALATAFKTRADAALVEVELENGEVIMCTPDHLFMLRDGTYCQAQHLCPGTSLYRRNLVDRNLHWQSDEFERKRKEALARKAATPQGHQYFAQRGDRNLKKYWQQDYERAKGNCVGNGQRGKPFLIARNQSEKGRALSRQIAQRIHKCNIYGVEVMSYIGLYNHKRLVHGVKGKLFNHRVIAVRPSKRREAVYCLNVPVYENFVISAGVFVHNCRMRLSIFHTSPIVLGQQKGKFEKVLQNNTRFGAGAEWKTPQDDEVLDDSAWEQLPLLRSLKDKATRQLGTSGSGNHFVEWGELELPDEDAQLGLPQGKYLALLSHSGSRGAGFQIANHYSTIAKNMHPELKQGKGDLSHLGWLPLNSSPGQEYWLAMNLAGRYASANHRVIHRLVSKAAGLKPAAVVENHHNFAWIEKLEDGREVYVHRKGATPAGEGVPGVIPGSMGDAGYVVRGRGNAASLNSASHGAGRLMSRKQAMGSITKTMRDQYLRECGVTLLGGGLDEAPQAYKNINAVMSAQGDLVDIIARFKPKIVMMTDDPRDI